MTAAEAALKAATAHFATSSDEGYVQATQ